jgi:hypothetical protein
VSELNELVLKHVGPGKEPEWSARRLTVRSRFDSDDEVLLDVTFPAEGLDTIGGEKSTWGWLSRKQARKLRDHLNALLEQPKRVSE